MNRLKIKLLLIGPFIAYRLVKAEDLRSRGEYAEADKMFASISDYFQNNPEYHLNRALIAHKLGYIDDCERFLKAFYKLAESHRRYSEEEKNYMYCFADRILNKVKQTKGKVALHYRGNYTDLSEDKVRKQLKLSFPVELVQITNQSSRPL